MPKHIRHQREEKKSYINSLSDFGTAIKKSINELTSDSKKEGFRGYEEPKILGLSKKHIAIIAVILFILLAHCMGWITLPSFIADLLPGKSAPANHLQYFFF